jgi:hypothetical protein
VKLIYGRIVRQQKKTMERSSLEQDKNIFDSIKNIKFGYMRESLSTRLIGSANEKRLNICATIRIGTAKAFNR